MNVGTLIATAFQQAGARYPELHQTWVNISARIGGLLPASLLMVSIQRDGHLDVVLRCMEDEFSSTGDESELELWRFHCHKIIAELWVGSVYESVRLLAERELISATNEFNALAHDLRLLRIPLEKHQIAGDRKLTAPLQMQRVPVNNEESDLYHYIKGDSARAHIMPTGVSARGSIMWHVIDLQANASRWLERRSLSDQFMTVFGLELKSSSK